MRTHAEVLKSRRPFFFVLSGAHGVGKSTAIAATCALLGNRGVAVRQFHHIVDGLPTKVVSAGSASSAVNGGSTWRRVVPPLVKMLVSSTFDAHAYMRGINLILSEAATNQQIAVADRFVYDRVVELRLRCRPLIQRAVLRAASSVMRRPTLTIVLIDDPRAIYQRKQELTEAEIARYQRDIVALCKQVGAPFVTVPVDGRGPDSVARALVETILVTILQGGRQVPRGSGTGSPSSAVTVAKT